MFASPDDTNTCSRPTRTEYCSQCSKTPSAQVPSPASSRIVAGDDGVTYEDAAGPVTADSVFRLASMTKIVTTVAALQLRELDLDAPVTEYRPEFADVQVLEGFDEQDGPDPAPAQGSGDRPPADDAHERARVLVLQREIARWEQLTGTPNVTQESARIFEAPMAQDPGTGFLYGIGVDWLGRVVEAISGRPLDEHLKAQVFEPLGMEHTSFTPHPGAVPVHVRSEEGWRALPGRTQPPDYPAGGHGLYSTPRDFMRFQRTLLDHEALFTPQTPFPEVMRSADRRFARDFVAGPGHSFGLGLLLDRAGRGSWWGLFNTHFWVDPATRVTGAVYTQTLPFMDERVRDVILRSGVHEHRGRVVRAALFVLHRLGLLARQQQRDEDRRDDQRDRPPVRVRERGRHQVADRQRQLRRRRAEAALRGAAEAVASARR